MTKYREIIRLKSLNFSERNIALSCSVSRNTVSKICKKAKELNIKIVNEMEVAYNYLPKNVKIIGITGSNGKTTTTTILYKLLRLHGIDAILGGNIGFPLSEVVNLVNVNSVLVLEISDHQLYNKYTY